MSAQTGQTIAAQIMSRTPTLSIAANGQTVRIPCLRQLTVNPAHPVPHDNSTILIGYGVSPFVPVDFENLITRISFSQPFFAPEDGETQQVSAVFAANVDWTLEIQDENSNDVLTTTGSGGTLSYAWDGNGTGGTNLPVGTYTYLITAVTNGLALPAGVGGGGDGGGAGSPPSPDFAFSDSSELWAMISDGSDAVPLAIYPPGFDTNSLTIFSATPAQVNMARASSSPRFVQLGRQRRRFRRLQRCIFPKQPRPDAPSDQSGQRPCGCLWLCV